MKRPTPKALAGIVRAMAEEWCCSLEEAAEAAAAFFPAMPGRCAWNTD